MNTINLRDPLTREQFEAGIEFIFYEDSAYRLKFEEDSLVSVSPNYPYTQFYCLVNKIDKTGFYYSKFIFGKQVTGKVRFDRCIPITEN